MFLVGVWLHTSINYMCYGCLHVQMTGEVQVTLEIQGIKKKGRTAVATSIHHHHPGHKMQNVEIYLHKIMLILLLFGYIRVSITTVSLCISIESLTLVSFSFPLLL
jgi:hypothetical protein